MIRGKAGGVYWPPIKRFFRREKIDIIWTQRWLNFLKKNRNETTSEMGRAAFRSCHYSLVIRSKLASKIHELLINNLLHKKRLPFLPSLLGQAFPCALVKDVGRKSFRKLHYLKITKKFLGNLRKSANNLICQANLFGKRNRHQSQSSIWASKIYSVMRSLSR